MVDNADIKQELYPRESYVDDGLRQKVVDYSNRLRSSIGIAVTALNIVLLEDLIFPTRNVLSAYKFAQRIHYGEPLRLDKRLYITHPVGVYRIVRELGVNDDEKVLALLHDVNEPYAGWFRRWCEKEEEKAVEWAQQHGIPRKADMSYVRKRFGDDIYYGVIAMTPPAKIFFNGNKQKRDEETYWNIVQAAASNPGVMLVRLADRLYNMNDLAHFKPERKLELAYDTLRYTEWAQDHISELGGLCKDGKDGIMDQLIVPLDEIALRIIIDAKEMEQRKTGRSLETRVKVQREPLRNIATAAK